MRKCISIFLLISFIFASNIFSQKGSLVIIGGGKRPPSIMKKIIELAGSENSKICILPMASGVPIKTAESQKKQFENFGAKEVFYLNASNEDALDESYCNKLEGVTGIFFSGGDQNRLTKVLHNTELLKRIKNIYNNGGVIAGTSAGAAVMSKIMITGDELLNKDTTRTFSTIMKGNIKTTEGFGFLDNCIIDQHFIKRKRHNRLISIVLENPKNLGIGIDESTAILVNADNTFKVIGESQVIIFDAIGATDIKVNEHGLFSASNINTHLCCSRR
jgi:cyanophycinase